MSKRTEAHNRADRNYRAKRKIVRVILHEEKDADTLEWLRSQVADDSEMPALIRRIVEERKQN